VPTAEWSMKTAIENQDQILSPEIS
jgi:hypothetical protein